MWQQRSTRYIEHLSYSSLGPTSKERDGPMGDDMCIKLRAKLKRQYHINKEAIFGDDLKSYWRSGFRMFKLNGLIPETWSH